MQLTRTAHAPGRVNLIGDHTDYNQGLALPMAIDRGTDVVYSANEASRLHLFSSYSPHAVELPVGVDFDRAVIDAVEPPWGRLAAAVVAQVGLARGGVVRVRSTLPVGAGLSSSAAFCVSLALALGVEVDARDMAVLCQRAEAIAGSSVGLMDPLVSMGGVAGHAIEVDFATLEMTPVPIPEDAELVVVHSGVRRNLARTPYASRRVECESAALELGIPLGRAEETDLAGIRDPLLRRRTRHVVTECARVRALAEAFRRGDLAGAGRLMDESHRSLAEDFEASTRAVDALADTLRHLPGVHGARMTGGGFGGCVVALTRPGAIDVEQPDWRGRAWRVAADGGARAATAVTAGR